MFQKRTMMTAFLLGSTCFLLAGYQNCQQNVGFSAQSSESPVSAFAPPATTPNSDPAATPPPTASQTTTKVLKTIKPALAVRGLACLFCHADVRANVITDFGYGDPWFLGGSALTIDDAALNGTSPQSWFNNDASAWQSMKELTGSVYVPKATIPTNIQASMKLATGTAPLSIAQMLTTPYQVAWDYDNSTAQEQSPMIMKVTPPTGQNAVIEVSQVKITSPSESDILTLAPSLTSGTSAFVRVGSATAVEFVAMNSGTTAYIKNDETKTLTCAGSDIVVSGTLYLRNLKVNATGGCRLYVSGSVFIEGPVTYSDSGATQNLQVTSANFISMGINTANLQSRLSDSRQAFISGARTYNDRFNQAIKESQNIGVLVDGQSPTNITIAYTNLLLNAPLVESRYLGSVQGTIVAQLALFALSNFNFQFSDVFSDEDVFPLLTNPILTAQ